MTEPPKLRLKDVALTVSSMAAMLSGGGLMAKLKAKQQAKPVGAVQAAAGVEEAA